MSMWRKQAVNYKSAISWLLVAAILFITVLPARFHFHHQNTENTATHEHEHLVDLHLSTNETLQTHEEEGAVTFTLASLDKKNNPTFTPLALFLILFIFFLLLSLKLESDQTLVISDINISFTFYLPHFAHHLKSKHLTLCTINFKHSYAANLNRLSFIQRI